MTVIYGFEPIDIEQCEPAHYHGCCVVGAGRYQFAPFLKVRLEGLTIEKAGQRIKFPIIQERQVVS